MTINRELLRNARAAVQKQAFVAAGDPAMGGDPAAAAGGAPPMDPAMAGGAAPMDPAMAGGGAPMDPAMAGGAPPQDPMAMIQPMIDQAVQAAMAGGGGGGAAGAAPKAKKFDPEELDRRMYAMDMNIAKIADALGVQLSPSDVVKPPAGETGPTQNAPEAEAPAAGGALGQIGEMAPMKAAEWEHGEVYDEVPSINSSLSNPDFKTTAEMATALLMQNRS
jgi:hypothetical protein